MNERCKGPALQQSPPTLLFLETHLAAQRESGRSGAGQPQHFKSQSPIACFAGKLHASLIDPQKVHQQRPSLQV